MINISYTESSQLQATMKKVDSLRKDILLSVISPKEELRLKWAATLDRLFWSLSLSENPLSKPELLRLITDLHNRTIPASQKGAIKYKKAFDHIIQDWLATQTQVTLKDVVSLNEIASPGKLNINADALKNSLAYFSTSNEHPVIQAGLIQYQLLYLSPTTSNNTRFASLMAYLFLFKEGFDCRGLLIIDEYLRKNFTDYQLLINQAKETGAQTLWLEFFAKAIESNLSKTLDHIDKNRIRIDIPASFVSLNSRQKEILALLENTDSSITNRQVQHLFKISQITASRDLTKLSALLLIIAHGKGRSVHYTRV